MNQEKIGKFIAEKRKENKLTQEQLAEQLNTLNELFIGEKILDEKYKEVADSNLLNALENSSFTLKEKIAFYKRKWKKEHISKFVLCFISLIIIIIALKFQNIEGYIIGTIAGMLVTLLYIVLYNQMMIYVENHAYKKIEK